VALPAIIALGAATLSAMVVGSVPSDGIWTMTRNSAWLAVGCYEASIVFLMMLNPEDWSARSLRGRAARWCWTIACVCLMTHVAAAFQFVHHWSHQHAFEHTRAIGGIGEGIYVNDLFMILWSADVAFWWLNPNGYATRPVAVDRVLHGFMLFIVFNAAFVFAAGPARWVALASFAILGLLWLKRRSRSLAAMSSNLSPAE
jgi:hypothetical protein